MFKGLLAAATLAACALPGGAAEAAQVLRFQDSNCSTSNCIISQSFGDNVGVDVSYRSLIASSGVTHNDFLKYWGPGYGDLPGVAWGGANRVDTASEVKLTAAAGYKISLIDFDFATYAGRSVTTPFTVLDLSGNVLTTFIGNTAWPKHGHATINTDYLDGVILRWGPDGYEVGVNNLQFDVKQIAGAVPEPGAWALMITGFAGVGAVLRRRRATAFSATLRAAG